MTPTLSYCPHCGRGISPGAILGAIRSELKARTSAENLKNAKRTGRPKGSKNKEKTKTIPLCLLCLENHTPETPCSQSTQPCLWCGKMLHHAERMEAVERFSDFSVKVYKPLCSTCFLKIKP